jgi:hypothetical protein
MDSKTWQAALLAQLDRSGREAQAASQFIRQRRIKVGFRKASPAVGAFWFIDGNIYLNRAAFSADSPVSNPRVLSLVVHEAQHLRQGVFTALSVYGELEAWQLGFRVYGRLTGTDPQPPLADLLELPLRYDRALLRTARDLMREFAGRGYHIDLLPLFPWVREARWWLTRTSPP